MTLPAQSPGLPRLRLVLAVSLDGRLAPPQGGAAQIGGRGDRRVLEESLAWADAVLVGAETIRRHGSSCLIRDADLLAARQRRGFPPQPLALVASRSGRIPVSLPFFRQPLERWLLLGRERAQQAAVPAAPQGFARLILMTGWEETLRQLVSAGLERLVVLGGAELAASLLAENRLDELQLTLCPRLLGGEHAWLGPRTWLPEGCRQGWRLLEQRRLEDDELLLRYGRESAGGGTSSG